MSRKKVVDCAFCEKENLSVNIIGLNKKIIHRQIERMLCLTCMAAYFETTEEELRDKIEEFKTQGCSLFS